MSIYHNGYVFVLQEVGTDSKHIALSFKPLFCINLQDNFELQMLRDLDFSLTSKNGEIKYFNVYSVKYCVNINERIIRLANRLRENSYEDTNIYKKIYSFQFSVNEEGNFEPRHIRIEQSSQIISFYVNKIKQDMFYLSNPCIKFKLRDFNLLLN